MLFRSIENGRLVHQAAFRLASSAEQKPPKIEIGPSNIPIIGGIIDDLAEDFIGGINKGLETAVQVINLKDVIPEFQKSNPYKYDTPYSSAPISIHDGKPSFTNLLGITAEIDAVKATTKLGGNFNPASEIGRAHV